MPGMIYADPRQRSPWETLLPQLLGTMIQAKMGQNLEIAEADRQAGIARKAEAERFKNKPKDIPKGYEAFWQQDAGYGGKYVLKERKLTEVEKATKARIQAVKDIGGIPAESITPKNPLPLGNYQTIRAGGKDYLVSTPEGFIRSRKDLSLKKDPVYEKRQKLTERQEKQRDAKELAIFKSALKQGETPKPTNVGNYVTAKSRAFFEKHKRKPTAEEVSKFWEQGIKISNPLAGIAEFLGIPEEPEESDPKGLFK